MDQDNEVSVGNEDFDLAGASAELSESLFGGGGDSGASDDDPVLEDSPAGDSSAAPAEPSAEEAAAAEVPVESAAEVVPAPKTWRPEAAAKWAALPPEVQQEVLKREQDIFKGLETYKADATIGKSFSQILAPYTPMLEAAGLDPLQQVEGLMRAHHALATGTPEQKALFFQRLAQDYNVSLGQPADDANPFVDPQVAALQSQLTALQSKLMEREAREASVVKQSLQKEIDDFASDPAHQYFDEVATDIAGLLRSKAAATLAEAYEKAVWANPVTRAKEQARLTAEAQAKAEASAAEKAEAARKASAANVRTSPKAASATAPLGSIDDTLSAALTAIRSRV